jgi:hypothetical protein
MSQINNLNIKNIQAIDSGTGSDRLLSNSIISINFDGQIQNNIEYKKIEDILVGSVIFLQNPLTSSNPVSYKITRISRDPVTSLYSIYYLSSSKLYEKFIERSPLRNISADIVSGVASITLPSTAGMFPGVALEKIDGDGVFGANYPVIQSVDSPTQITLTTSHITSGSVVFHLMEDRGNYIGTEEFHNLVEFVATDNLGAEGWALTANGSAIFSDIYARGQIEATTGSIQGTLEIGTNNAENAYMLLGSDIFYGEPFDNIAKQHNGIFINNNNYLLTYPQSNDKTIASVVVTNPQVTRTKKIVTLNLASHDFVLGTTTDGSVDATEYFVLSGLTGDLEELNGTQRVAALTTTSATFNIYSETSFNSTYTGLSGSVQKFGNYEPYSCSSISISSVSELTSYSLVRLNVSGNTLEEGDFVDIDGLSGVLIPINSSFQVVNSASSYVEVEYYDNLIAPNTYSQTGTVSSLDNNTKFKIGSSTNFMKYDSAIDALTVTGTINANAGNFTSTVTIGDSSIPGKLQVGTATGTESSWFEIIGTDSKTSTVIKTKDATYGTSGVWLSADGKFSLGNKLTYDGVGTLTVSGIATDSIVVGQDPNQVKIANDVQGSNDGIYITKSGDYWYSDASFRIGGSSGISYSGTGNVTIGTGVTVGGDISTATGTITGQTFRTSSTATTNGVIFDSAGVRGYNSSVKKFDLTSSGILTVTGANVTGTINASSGYFESGYIGGTTSGWEISSNTIKSVGGTNKVYLVNGSNPKISITSNSTSKGSFIAGDTPFYVDGDGRLSLGTQMYFDPNDTQSFGKLTVIGRISGAIDNVTTVPTDSNTFSVSQAVISETNQAVLTTTATHTFIAGDTVVVAGLTGNASVANGAFVVLSTPAPTATTFAVTISSGTNGTVTDQTGTAKIREMTLGLHGALSGSPAGYGIRLDENNYWFVNNQFKVGTSGSYFSWDGATLEVKGKVTSTDGEIGAWTLSNEELYSDISDTGNTYRTGIKAATGIGGDIYTPSVFYMVHDHDISNQTPSWAEPWTPFYADSNGRFSLSDRLYFDQDIHNSTGAKLTALINSGRIGGFDATDPLGWTIGRGFLYSGYGTSFVSLAAPGAVPDANSAIFFTPTKITVDAEGGGYSSIYIELEFYSATGYTSLAEYLADNNNLEYTQSQIEASNLIYEECVANVFSDTLGRFVNIEGSTSLNNTSINPEFDNLANRYLSIQAAETYPYYLEQNSSTSASSATESVGFGADSEKIILVIYGEDYVYSNIKDEQIIFPFDVTINIGSSTFTKVSHGLEAGDEIRFTTGGSLPTGIALNTTYYVRDVSENSFKVSSTLNGIAVSLSGTQSGTHTIVKILESTLGGGEDFYSSGKIEIYVAQNNTLNLPVFWAGDTDPEFSSISITNTGNISSNSLTSSSVITDSFKLSDYNVIISDTEPDGAVAGDIWIDIS